jgi:predicted nucleotidyltransferase
MSPADMRRKVLLKAEVGSGMWGMKHPGSDTDLFVVYKVPTSEILSGAVNPGVGRGHSSQDKVAQVDSAAFELQHVINELLKGNINFIWGITSQMVETETIDMVWLRSIVLKTAAKSISHSARGLAASCIRDVDTGKTTEKRQVVKKYRQAIRTLRFASNWLMGRGAVFQSVPEEEATRQEYAISLWAFEYSLQYSRLPEKVDASEFRELLLFVRLSDLTLEAERLI